MRDTTLASDDRGLSREAVVALGFGMTLVMMAVVGGVLLGMEDNLTSTQSGPVVQTSADAITAGDGPDDQWVRINHENGDTVDVSNITVTVWLPEHRKRSTLTDLPTPAIEQSDYDHNHVFTLGDRGIDGAIDADDSDGRWGAGDAIAFRLAHSRVPLEPGQRVNVTVRHAPSETKLAKLSLTVENG